MYAVNLIMLVIMLVESDVVGGTYDLDRLLLDGLRYIYYHLGCLFWLCG